jgi:O-antigen chain-terminating methyltransferase
MDMDESEQFDAERLRARIRENAIKRRGAVDHPSSASEQASLDADADLRQLEEAADVTQIPLASHRWLTGSLVLLAKNMLTKLLTPVLTQQTAYNSINARMIDAGRRERARLQDELGLVTRHQLQIQDAVDALGRQSAELQAQLQAGAGRLQQSLDMLAQQRLDMLAQLAPLAPRQTETEEQLAALSRQTGTLQDTIRRQAEAHAQALQTHAQALQTHAQALQTTREQVLGAERKVRRVLHALSNGEGPLSPVVSAGRTAPPAGLESDFDYGAFQERFRGSEDSTKARQRVYLEHFKGCENVVEIGCGRGEFLELLREIGVAAKGLDLDLDNVLRCREKGLDALRQDALAYLESVADDSLGGVFSAQVIEHMETPSLARLISLCHRKLRPGGVLVLETLNPECLFVVYRWFWIDPTHIRLVHPETLKFMVESAGFGQVGCQFLPPGDSALTIPPLETADPLPPELVRFNEATDYLNKLLYGSADYAVTGTK